MNLDRIDFISAYCDRWCERCAFTSRCSAYAVDVAMAMCDGDFAAALELAVGAPPPRNAAEAANRESFLATLRDDQPTESDVDEIRRDEQAVDERVDESPITTGAKKLSMLAHRWFDANPGIGRQPSNSQLAEAIDVAGWDAHLIGAKLHRALKGRDPFMHGNAFDDHPLQNDWNGSAKVALISIRRSIDAWATIAVSTGDLQASAVADVLRHLETEVERTFPEAWKFIRPGFDQMP